MGICISRDPNSDKKVEGKVLITRKKSDTRIGGVEIKLSTD